ncbi:hypothetical protein AVEN_202875-1 [Araneus ventricosus]|uniref:Uncharacterized protein n=1 Tax=Araneus ventricosus TaxID=182803 RepID=A0A4Y2FI80_ARAVE|nr:hypothetical protein AVEN_202875-1 [Araneus ventricosus]
MKSETEITTLNRKRGNIKSQITKLANALVDKTEHSIPKLQAQLDVVSKLQEKFELQKNDYYKITNQTEFAEVESSRDSVEDDLLNLEDFFSSPLSRLSYSAKETIFDMNPIDYSCFLECWEWRLRFSSSMIQIYELHHKVAIIPAKNKGECVCVPVLWSSTGQTDGPRADLSLKFLNDLFEHPVYTSLQKNSFMTQPLGFVDPSKPHMSFNEAL